MNRTRRRVLLLSVSAGAGHVRAAEALRVAAEAQGLVAQHLDVMDFVSSAFRVLYTDFYLKLVEHHPAVWAMLYRIMDRTPPSTPLARVRRAIERLNTLKLRKAVAAFVPDAIVCTHFLPAELLMRERARGRVTSPVYVQITDFDLHGMWIVPDMAGYFVASDEVAFRAHARGIAAAQTHVTGIPIMPNFASPPMRGECAAELGIDADRRTILLMGGGAGLGSVSEIAKGSLKLPARVADIRISPDAKLRDATWAVAYGLALWGLTGDTEAPKASSGKRISRAAEKFFRQFLP